MNESLQNSLRGLPGVEAVLNEPLVLALQEQLARPLVAEIVRHVIAEERSRLLSEASDASSAATTISSTPSSPATPAATQEALARAVHARAQALIAPTLCPAINASGVVLHTNLGRSVLPQEAQEAVAAVQSSYSTLEYDLSVQGRGSRHSHVEELLCAITGAEAAMAVNNNAAAVLLVLSALARGGEVIVSRGELVEIGGSFRIPDIMEQSGACMVEVGTTNRTRLKDYAKAIGEHTRLLAKVHPSNYYIGGFTHTTSAEELSDLARRHTLPLYCDQGTGLLVNLREVLPNGAKGSWEEPTVGELLASGCDLVSFSGDKLLGGPQAGISAGKRELIERLKQHPLTRALRLDKLSLAALAATLRLYVEPSLNLAAIPTLHLLSKTREELFAQAEQLASALREQLDPALCTVSVSEEMGRVGGGTLPNLELPNPVVALTPLKGSVDRLASWLINFEKAPIIARVNEGRLLLDVRTLAGERELACIKEALASYAAHQVADAAANAAESQAANAAAHYAAAIEASFDSAGVEGADAYVTRYPYNNAEYKKSLGLAKWVALSGVNTFEKKAVQGIPSLLYKNRPRQI